jgi:Domain of unknown function (DUF3471)
MAPLSAPVGSLVGKSPPANAAPERRLSAYTGVYKNLYFGDGVVIQRENVSALRLGPARHEYALHHWDGDVFTYTPSGEDANDGSISKVTFSLKPPAPATALDIEFYRDSGWSRFTRR